MKSLDKNKIWIEKTGIISPNTGEETIIIHNAFKLDKPLDKKKTDRWSGPVGPSGPIYGNDYDKKKTKELDWHIKWDYLLNKKKWKNPDEVNKVLTKFVEDLLTQQRTELLEEINKL